MNNNHNVPFGSLWRNMPRNVKNPPIEAVVFAWGVGEDGQTGLDERGNINYPKVVDAFLGMPLAGRNPVMGSSPIVGGSRNTLAIDGDGQVWSWGWNDRGTLGLGHSQPVSKPQRLAALEGVKIVQVDVNGWHCLALSDTGQLYAWGGNEYFQCGVNPETRDILTPTPCLPRLKVKQMACGGMHSLALLEDGSVWTWGEPWGDFSLNVQRHPRPVPGAVGMAAIAAGAFHNMALSLTGEVFTWGTNDYGQLGNGHTTYDTKPRRVVDMEGIQVADITAGGWHSLAITIHGEVYAWGRGEYGRLGIGDTSGSSKLKPHKVRGMEGYRVVQVAAGGTHTLALSAEGRIWSWGRASFGRLGLGSPSGLPWKEVDAYSPVEVNLPGGPGRWFVCAIAAGGRHSMCLALPIHQRPNSALGGSSLASGSEKAAASEMEVDGASEASLAYREPTTAELDGFVGTLHAPSRAVDIATKPTFILQNDHGDATGLQQVSELSREAASTSPDALRSLQQAADSVSLQPSARPPSPLLTTIAPVSAMTPPEAPRYETQHGFTLAAPAGEPTMRIVPPQEVAQSGAQQADNSLAHSQAATGMASALIVQALGGSQPMSTTAPTADDGSRNSNGVSASASKSGAIQVPLQPANDDVDDSRQQTDPAGDIADPTITRGTSLGSLPSIELSVGLGNHHDNALYQQDSGSPRLVGHRPSSPSRLSKATSTTTTTTTKDTEIMGLTEAALASGTVESPRVVQPAQPEPTATEVQLHQGTQPIAQPYSLRPAYASSLAGSARRSSSLDSPTKRSQSPRAVSVRLQQGSTEPSVFSVEGREYNLSGGFEEAAAAIAARELEEAGPSPGLIPSRPPPTFTDMHSLVDMSLEDEDAGEQRKLAAKARRRATRLAIAEALQQQQQRLNESEGTGSARGSVNEDIALVNIPDVLEGDSTSPASGDDAGDGDDEDEEGGEGSGLGAGSVKSRLSFQAALGDVRERTYPSRPMSPSHAAFMGGRTMSGMMVAGPGSPSGTPVSTSLNIPGASTLRVSSSNSHEVAALDVAARLAAAVVGSPRSSQYSGHLADWGSFPVATHSNNPVQTGSGQPSTLSYGSGQLTTRTSRDNPGQPLIHHSTSMPARPATTGMSSTASTPHHETAASTLLAANVTNPGSSTAASNQSAAAPAPIAASVAAERPSASNSNAGNVTSGAVGPTITASEHSTRDNQASVEITLGGAPESTSEQSQPQRVTLTAAILNQMSAAHDDKA